MKPINENIYSRLQISDTILRFFGVKRKEDGTPDKSCLVIVSMFDDLELSRVVTNEFGEFEIKLTKSNLEPGIYKIGFNIGKGIEVERWETYEITAGDLGQDDPIKFLQTPSLDFIGESINDIDISVNRDEYSVVKIMLSDLKTEKGKIKNIAIYIRISSDDPQNENEWKIFDNCEYSLENYLYPEVPGQEVQEFNSGKFVIKKAIELHEKPISKYDFYICFANSSGVFARNVDESLLKLSEDDVQFSGIINLNEYMGVPSTPQVLNAVDNSLLSNFARVNWEDLKKKLPSYFPITVYDGFDHTSHSLLYREAKKIQSYVIFMYVRDSQINPINEYPGNSSYWYFMGEFEKTDIEIRCPFNSYVGFWIGFRLDEDPITSQIPKQNLTI